MIAFCPGGRDKATLEWTNVWVGIVGTAPWAIEYKEEAALSLRELCCQIVHQKFTRGLSSSSIIHTDTMPTDKSPTSQ